MNTPAHLILGAAVFARRAEPRVTIAAYAGALLPDLSLYLLTGWALFVQRIPAATVFGTLYFSEPWQRVFAVDNSFLFWGAAFAIGRLRRSDVTVAFTGAGLLHLVADFLLHHDDARRMFWPLTTWIFRSPVSYWDPQHYGRIVAPIELVCALALCVVLWRQLPSVRSRVTVVVLAAAEAAPALAWRAMG